MAKMQFNANSIDYKYIFEYYDFPLAFISDKIEDYYYFFYFIDDNQYFIKPLSIKNIELIFSRTPIRDILNEFLKEDNFQVIEFVTESEANLYTIKEFESYQSEVIEVCFPEPDLEFEYEYSRNLDFLEVVDTYKEDFSDIFYSKNLTIRLKDDINSHFALPEIVIGAIEFIKVYIEQNVSLLADSSIFPNDQLRIAPFSPGSFNVNFKLIKPDEVSIFEENELYFDDFILFMDSIDTVDSEILFKELLHENKTILHASERFYKQVKDSQTEIEILSNSSKMVAITPSESVDRKFEELHALSQRIDEADLLINDESFEGIVKSANNTRNTVSIEVLGSSIKAKFKKEIFQNIKDLKQSVSISKEIRGIWQKTSFIDKEGIEVNTKYEILEFHQ